MTNLTNQISINGNTTTFLNYVDPIISLVDTGLGGITSLLNAHWGSNTQRWASSTSGRAGWGIRFPVPWETKTGVISGVDTGGSNTGNARVILASSGSGSSSKLCTSNANGTTSFNTGSFGNYQNAPSSYGHITGVLNDHALCIAAFSGSARTTVDGVYIGWLKEGVYSGLVYPRNLVFIRFNQTSFDTSMSLAVAQENLTTSRTIAQTLTPTICTTSTPGADSSDVCIQYSDTSQYIGKLWNMMKLPSSAVVGKIYRNTGIDPDTGIVETGQRSHWMCIGIWGTNKIGMRVWTDNVI